MEQAPWYLYIIRAGDSRLYTGITTDPQRRLGEHQAGRRLGAKALRGRQPLRLVYTRGFADRSAASKAEYQVKQLARPMKERLIAGDITLQSLLDNGLIR
jgi:putative endonuclease